MSTSKTPRQRYFEKVRPGLADRPDCWGWDAKIDKYGNASFSYTEPGKQVGEYTEIGRKVSINAARWAWIEFKSPIPEGYKVANTCGLKSCQNLDHWELKPTNQGKSLWELYEAKFTRLGPDECWLWQPRSRDKDGYGIFSYRDPETKKSVTVRATRWAWERLYGPLDPGAFVCHTCDSPPCQNPAHWFSGTAGANNADKKAKGREIHAKGEEHYRAQLPWEDVVKARRMFATGRWTHQALADRFGITRRSMSKILSGKNRRTS